MEINDIKKIEDLQDSFNTAFPFLKIEFFEEPHHWYEGSPQKEAFPKTKLIANIRKQHDHGMIEIHSWHRTGDVESAFRKKFDLNVQVFRREKDGWVQTVGTDKLTLKEQNDIGQAEITD